MQNSGAYSKIEYEAGACFGFCPIFKITILPDRSAVIEAEHFTFSEGRSKDDFNHEREGTFTVTLTPEDYQQLLTLLDAANPRALQSYYGNRQITDLPTATLRLFYKDGTQKEIEDYGKHGTVELAAIYRHIENLRKTRQWTKTDG